VPTFYGSFSTANDAAKYRTHWGSIQCTFSNTEYISFWCANQAAIVSAIESPHRAVIQSANYTTFHAAFCMSKCVSNFKSNIPTINGETKYDANYQTNFTTK
jgi:hypothetical protein